MPPLPPQLLADSMDTEADLFEPTTSPQEVDKDDADSLGPITLGRQTPPPLPADIFEIALAGPDELPTALPSELRAPQRPAMPQSIPVHPFAAPAAAIELSPEVPLPQSPMDIMNDMVSGGVVMPARQFLADPLSVSVPQAHSMSGRFIPVPEPMKVAFKLPEHIARLYAPHAMDPTAGAVTHVSPPVAATVADALLPGGLSTSIACPPGCPTLAPPSTWTFRGAPAPVPASMVWTPGSPGPAMLQPFVTAR